MDNKVTLAFYKKEILVLNAESISYYWTRTSRKMAYNSEGKNSLGHNHSTAVT